MERNNDPIVYDYGHKSVTPTLVSGTPNPASDTAFTVNRNEQLQPTIHRGAHQASPSLGFHTNTMPSPNNPLRPPLPSAVVTNQPRPSFRASIMDDPRDMAQPPRRTTPALQHTSSDFSRDSRINNGRYGSLDDRGVQYPSSSSSQPIFPANDFPHPRQQLSTGYGRNPGNMSNHGSSSYPNNVQHSSSPSYRHSSFNSNVGAHHQNHNIRDHHRNDNVGDDHRNQTSVEPEYVNYHDPRWRKRNPEAASRMEQSGIVQLAVEHDFIRLPQSTTSPQQLRQGSVGGGGGGSARTAVLILPPPPPTPICHGTRSDKSTSLNKRFVVPAPEAPLPSVQELVGNGRLTDMEQSAHASVQSQHSQPDASATPPPPSVLNTDVIMCFGHFRREKRKFESHRNARREALNRERQLTELSPPNIQKEHRTADAAVNKSDYKSKNNSNKSSSIIKSKTAEPPIPRTAQDRSHTAGSQHLKSSRGHPESSTVVTGTPDIPKPTQGSSRTTTTMKGSDNSNNGINNTEKENLKKDNLNKNKTSRSSEKEDLPPPKKSRWDMRDSSLKDPVAERNCSKGAQSLSADQESSSKSSLKRKLDEKSEVNEKSKRRAGEKISSGSGSQLNSTRPSTERSKTRVENQKKSSSNVPVVPEVSSKEKETRRPVSAIEPPLVRDLLRTVEPAALTTDSSLSQSVRDTDKEAGSADTEALNTTNLGTLTPPLQPPAVQVRRETIETSSLNVELDDGNQGIGLQTVSPPQSCEPSATETSINELHITPTVSSLIVGTPSPSVTVEMETQFLNSSSNQTAQGGMNTSSSGSLVPLSEEERRGHAITAVTTELAHDSSQPQLDASSAMEAVVFSHEEISSSPPVEISVTTTRTPNGQFEIDCQNISTKEAAAPMNRAAETGQPSVPLPAEPSSLVCAIVEDPLQPPAGAPENESCEQLQEVVLVEIETGISNDNTLQPDDLSPQVIENENTLTLNNSTAPVTVSDAEPAEAETSIISSTPISSEREEESPSTAERIIAAPSGTPNCAQDVIPIEASIDVVLNTDPPGFVTVTSSARDFPVISIPEVTYGIEDISDDDCDSNITIRKDIFTLSPDSDDHEPLNLTQQEVERRNEIQRKKAEEEEQKRKENKKKESTRKILLEVRDAALTCAEKLTALCESCTSEAELLSPKPKVDQYFESAHTLILAVDKAKVELAGMSPNRIEVATPQRCSSITLAMFESYFPLLLQIQDMLRDDSPKSLGLLLNLRKVEHRLIRLLKYYGANESVFMHYSNQVAATASEPTTGDYIPRAVEAWDKIQTFPHELPKLGIINDYEKVGLEKFRKQVVGLQKFMDRSKAKSVVSGQPASRDVPVPVTSSNHATNFAPVNSAQDSSSGVGTMNGSSRSESESPFSGHALVNVPAHGYQPLSSHGIHLYPSPGNTQTPHSHAYYMAGTGSNGFTGIVPPPVEPEVSLPSPAARRGRGRGRPPGRPPRARGAPSTRVRGGRGSRGKRGAVSGTPPVDSCSQLAQSQSPHHEVIQVIPSSTQYLSSIYNQPPSHASYAHGAWMNTTSGTTQQPMVSGYNMTNHMSSGGSIPHQYVSGNFGMSTHSPQAQQSWPAPYSLTPAHSGSNHQPMQNSAYTSVIQQPVRRSPASHTSSLPEGSSISLIPVQTTMSHAHAQAARNSNSYTNRGPPVPTSYTAASFQYQYSQSFHQQAPANTNNRQRIPHTTTQAEYDRLLELSEVQRILAENARRGRNYGV